MRIFLAALVVIIGANIGINAIRSVSQMQDAKMSRFCQSIPVGSSYDQECAKFRWWWLGWHAVARWLWRCPRSKAFQSITRQLCLAQHQHSKWLLQRYNWLKWCHNVTALILSHERKSFKSLLESATICCQKEDWAKQIILVGLTSGDIMLKYRIEWVKEKKNQQWISKQQCVVYDDESALHIVKNLQKDPKISCIDVLPVLWQLAKWHTIGCDRPVFVYY